ncbi:cytochrome P450 4C1-like [Thrips palmi]|uniref:Cytochrome P450 4C1-like n=1 Tax=Thrips palmi TaxID=161013 RepID=A0A6P8YCN5_THRPL|nr:cytochrome P450 4C1-like [Thrips palmi]
MDPVLLAMVALLVAIAVHLGLKRKAFVDRVNAIPGPPTTPLVGNLFRVAQHNFEVLATCQDYAKDYKDIFRVWIASFPYVALNTAEYVESVLSSVQHIEKSNDYSTLHPWLRFGLLTSTGSKWHTRRRLLTPTFHFKILDQFVPVFNRNVDVLVRKLSREAEHGKPFNVSHHVHLCALDTICESAMGTKVNAQENAESEYVNAVKTVCCQAYSRLVKPWIYPNVTFYSTPGGWSFNRALKVLHGMTSSVISIRKREFSTEDLVNIQNEAEDGTKKRVAFLDQLLLANQKGADLSDIDIQEEVDTFMFEGHDTTGTAISFGLYELSKNQDVQQKAYEEVVSILGEVGEGRQVETADLAKMKYLERVIKEVLRLYPSVPVFLRALHSDLVLPPVKGAKESYTVPAGTSIFVSPFTLHRVEALWPDPERFDPDRFLPENSVGRHPFAYIPFSAGPRNCIGQKYAIMEMKCIFARLIQEYRFLEAYPGYQAEVVGELILKPKGDGILVRAQRREVQV